MKTIFFISIFFWFSSWSYAASCDCKGESGYVWTNNRHNNPSAGGCVSSSSYVDETVFIAKTALVCGDSFVSGNNIKIYGNAVISGRTVIEGNNIRIGSNAIIKGNAIIQSNTAITNKTISEGRFGNQNIDGIKDAEDARRREQQRKEAAKNAIKRIPELQKQINNTIESYSDGGLRLDSLEFVSKCTFRVSGASWSSAFMTRIDLRRNHFSYINTNSILEVEGKDAIFIGMQDDELEYLFTEVGRLCKEFP